MDIAPDPRRGRDSAHDGMVRLMKMFGRVLARRGIAATNVTAGLALAQRDPKSSLRQALGKCVGCLRLGKVGCAQARQMFTRPGHIIPVSQTHK